MWNQANISLLMQITSEVQVQSMGKNKRMYWQHKGELIQHLKKITAYTLCKTSRELFYLCSQHGKDDKGVGKDDTGHWKVDTGHGKGRY